jgi:anti-anti-sigma factor
MQLELMIQTRTSGSSTIIELVGRLEHTTVSRLNRTIQASLNHDTPEVVLDFDKVTWLDSRAIGQFMVYQQLLKKNDKKLVLANCKGALLAALRLVNFHKIFEIR